MPLLNPVDYVDSQEILGRSPSPESLRVMWRQTDDLRATHAGT
jgi:hypothetical protein